MCAIECDAAFYRGHLTGGESPAPLAVALATIVALWSLVYLVGSIAPMAKPPAVITAAQWASLAAQHMAP